MPQTSIALQDDTAGTHFKFHGRVFSAPGAHFTLHGPERVPVFTVDMGGGEAMIGIDALRTEFKIPTDSPDGRMIALAVQGLHHVPDIRPGDRIPSEVLDGTASWSVLPRHKQIAERRLQAQLISWVSGKETILTKAEDLAMFLEQIENKGKIREAFGSAAAAIGLPRENPTPVLERIEAPSRELCYIEALRDKFGEIIRMDDRLKMVADRNKGDRRTRGDIDRVRAMLKEAKSKFAAIFRKADASTGKIIEALKELQGAISLIRKVRDELHYLTIEWEPILKSWRGMKSFNTPELFKVIDQTYRFLAQRFSTTRSLIHRDGFSQSSA